MRDYEVNVTHLLKKASDSIGEMHLKILMLECRAEEAESERDALKEELRILREEAGSDNTA